MGAFGEEKSIPTLGTHMSSRRGPQHEWFSFGLRACDGVSRLRVPMVPFLGVGVKGSPKDTSQFAGPPTLHPHHYTQRGSFAS